MTRTQPMFSAKSLLAELATYGLRLARHGESGWWYQAWCGTKVYVVRI